jgi:hypothetical protein
LAAAAVNPRTVDDSESASMVTASYLSEYHVHQKKKPDSETLSDFQKRLTEFSDNIARLGTIRKLVNITNGNWLTALECAEEAINEAGNSAEFGFHYRALASANDNDIELVIDQYLPKLLWQPLAGPPDHHTPGSFFLSQICSQVFELVIFF